LHRAACDADTDVGRSAQLAGHRVKKLSAPVANP
jgi:hypothetical protein